MSDIRLWSTAAASNNATPPDGFPEGMAPNTLNDASREVMAATRRKWEDAEWMDWGHTPTFATTASFTLAGDQTAIYHAGRRIRASAGSTTYGKISSSSYSTVTRVSVTLDSGELSAGMSMIAVGILSAVNHAMPTAAEADYLTMVGETSTANASAVLITGTYSSVLSMSLGSVTAGDRLMVNASARMHAPIDAGNIGVRIVKASGTAGIRFGYSASSIGKTFSVQGTSTYEYVLSPLVQITGSGTLVLGLESKAYTGTASLAANYAQMYAFFMKKA